MRQRASILFTASVLALLLAAAPSWVSAQSDWRPAKGPLMTRWAKDVSPAKALPEYPRPQMTRREWMNLNGLWDYAVTGRDDPRPRAWQGKILVPFPIESALSGVIKPVTEKEALWYRRVFTLPRAYAGKRTLLHFGAADWEARVYVNGREVGSHRGGYDPFTFDITPALRKTGPQEVVVAVRDATDRSWQARGKQVLRPGGIFYTPCTGLWQTVWLEPVPQASIAMLKITPDVDRSSLRLMIDLRGAERGLSVEAVALDGKRPVARARGLAGSEIVLPVRNAKLWTPDHPFLYGLKVTLERGKRTLDTVDSYFGMRKISLGKDARGVTRILLNNRFVFQAGPLDQGFWPDGIYTAPTDTALRYDIEITKRLGFNMARKHVKVEPERWYYWCDRLGLLVWQDMPSGDRFIGGNDPDIKRSPESADQYEQELRAMIETHRNHPSIVMWVVFNEGWGQFDTPRITALAKRLDPSRLVNNASGWTDRGVGNVIDMHAYPGPGSPKPEPRRAAVLGEFGGLGLAVPSHTWSRESWGYQGMPSPRALTRRYVDLWKRAWALKDDGGLSAAVYTQTTDVETECNGLLTYDRAVLKVDEKAARDAARGIFPPAPTLRALVPASQKEPQLWHYTFEPPAADWTLPDFDDSAWQVGPAGFGRRDTPGAVTRTAWTVSDIWLRREFTLPERWTGTPELWMHHDEDAEVYINGVLAAKVAGFLQDYDLFEITSQARAALKPGRNVLAVHCRQTAGGQYIDVGIVAGK